MYVCTYLDSNIPLTDIPHGKKVYVWDFSHDYFELVTFLCKHRHIGRKKRRCEIKSSKFVAIGPEITKLGCEISEQDNHKLVNFSTFLELPSLPLTVMPVRNGTLTK